MPDPEKYKLKRALGFWAAFSIVVGTTIGSGIFRVPSEMVRAVGSPSMVFAVWIFGGVLSLFGALTYAELSAMLPEAGGEYVYLNAAYGPFFGFIYGWTQTWVAKAASIAAMGTLFATYLADFFPGLNSVLFTVPLPIGPEWKPTGHPLGTNRRDRSDCTRSADQLSRRSAGRQHTSCLDSAQDRFNRSFNRGRGIFQIRQFR